MKSFEFDRITHLADKDAKRLTTDKPKVEEISLREIYLLNEQGHRVSKICGKVDEEGWPCTKSSGVGTLHEGEGRCKQHDSPDTDKKEYLGRLLETLSADSDMTEFFKKADLAEEDFFDTERLTRAVSAMLYHHISANQFNWSEKKLDRAIDLVETYRRLIDTQQKKEMGKIIATALAVWLRAVMSVIFNNVSPETYSKVVSQISSIELPPEIEAIQFEEVK